MLLIVIPFEQFSLGFRSHSKPLTEEYIFSLYLQNFEWNRTPGQELSTHGLQYKRSNLFNLKQLLALHWFYRLLTNCLGSTFLARLNRVTEHLHYVYQMSVFHSLRYTLFKFAISTMEGVTGSTQSVYLIQQRYCSSYKLSPHHLLCKITSQQGICIFKLKTKIVTI